MKTTRKYQKRLPGRHSLSQGQKVFGLIVAREGMSLSLKLKCGLFATIYFNDMRNISTWSRLIAGKKPGDVIKVKITKITSDNQILVVPVAKHKEHSKTVEAMLECIFLIDEVTKTINEDIASMSKAETKIKRLEIDVKNLELEISNGARRKTVKKELEKTIKEIRKTISAKKEKSLKNIDLLLSLESTLDSFPLYRRYA